jgi:hypothetical protein
MGKNRIEVFKNGNMVFNIRNISSPSSFIWKFWEKYGKVSLTAEGKKSAVEVLRKHRLWETFLYEKMEFTWDEVHEVAEQLEHIQSQKLINKLDRFLGFPRANDPFDKEVLFNANGQAVPTVNNPYGLTFDPTYVYAPNQGIRGFLGVRLTIN